MTEPKKTEPELDDVPRPGPDGRYTFAQLIEIMVRLRDPEHGCPWDVTQTFESIAPYTIEEAYEVADAIERQDLEGLREELGDLLLQVVYHALIAHEQSAFAIEDVAHGICEKMIRRHPHVFGRAEERRQGPVPGFWDRIKAEEKARARRSFNKVQDDPRPSLLDDVPANLPGLPQAIKLQKKAAKVGFDWASLGPVFNKMREELDELSAAIDSGDTDDIEAEFGDLLFVMANVARHLKIDPESGLRHTNAKFRRRFRAIEVALSDAGRRLEDATLEEMDALWDEAKRREKDS